jgi:hypothetical protein
MTGKGIWFSAQIDAKVPRPLNAGQYREEAARSAYFFEHGQNFFVYLNHTKFRYLFHNTPKLFLLFFEKTVCIVLLMGVKYE